MIRKFALGLIPLSLSACAAHLAPPAEYKAPPADVPDAALVAPCDRAEADPATNGELASELNHTRRQRNDCADRMDGVRQWRSDALKRADKANAPLPK